MVCYTARMRIVSILAALAALSSASASEPDRSGSARIKEAVADLEKMTAREMASTGIPGIAIAVVYQGEVVFAKGFGVREVGKEALVDADTVFPLASLSKPIGSTVVAAAVGEGPITWDSRISQLDPGFAMSEPWVTSEITVRDFYAHRSGLPSHAGDLLEDIGFSREEILHRLRFQQPATSFRSGYAYTNFGMTEGAVAVARAMGKSWEDLSEDLLYRPLGMGSTSSRQADFLARKNRASGHVFENGKWAHKLQRNPDAQSPAGGVTSSVNDLTKWMRLQLAGGKSGGKQLIDQAALEETHHPHMLTGFRPDNGLPTFYGLGWNVSYDAEGRLRLSHSGAFEMGAATAVFLVPSEQLGIVVLTNAYPMGVAEALGATFLDRALYGKSTHDWASIFKGAFDRMRAEENAAIADYSHPPASPAAAAPNSAYTGTYTNDFFGDVVVAERDGGLTIGLGPKPLIAPLTHWDRDIFTYPSASETLTGPSGAFFTVGPAGTATAVVVENLNRFGNGTFVRKSP